MCDAEIRNFLHQWAKESGYISRQSAYNMLKELDSMPQEELPAAVKWYLDAITQFITEKQVEELEKNYQQAKEEVAKKGMK